MTCGKAALSLALLLAGCGGAAATSATPASSPAAKPSSAAAPAKATETMKVSYPAFSASMAPVLIGIEKGYYAEEGLDIQMVNAGGGASTPSLIAGEVPYTTSAGSAISAIINGAPLKVIYTTEDRPGYELWAVPPDIKTVADIKGKTVGIQTRGDTNEIAMNLFLRSQGMPVNSVIYAAMGSEQNKLAAMQNGSVPLALIGASTAHQYQTSGGTGHLLVDLKKEVHMVYTGLATSDKELAQNRDRAKRFLRATIKGRIYWKMFKEETIQILGKYNHLSHDANELDYDDDYPALTADGTVSADIQQADTAVRAQIIGVNPPPTDKIYDYSVLQEVNRELQASGWQPQR